MMTSPAMTKNGHMTRRGAPPRAVVGMITDKTTHALLTQIATQRGIPFAFGIGCIEEALADLASDETADCVIVEIVDNSAAIDDVAILASQLPPRTELILIGAFTELEKSDLALAGASLCIEKPPSEAMLESIFGLPLRPPAAQSAEEPFATDSPARHVPTELPPPALTGRDNSPASPRASTAAGPSAVPLPAVEPIPLRVEAPEPKLKARQSDRLSSAHPSIPSSPRTDPSPVQRLQANDVPATPKDLPARTLGAVGRQWNDAPTSYDYPPTRPALRQGRVIAVTGCRGGVGATSIAVSVAWLLSEEFGHSTALLDLDSHFGSVALALNLDPGEALHQALERPTRVDGVFLDRAVRKVGQNLFVLSSERPLDSTAKIDPAGPASLIGNLANRYQRVVVDLPRGEPEGLMRVLSLADEIILVTDLSLPGARDAVRLLTLVRKASAYAHVRIVGGCARDASKAPALSPSEFRRAVGTAFEISIAYDPEAASDAARSGRPIAKVSPRSAVGKTLRSLVQSLEPVDQRERKRRLLFWKN